MRIVHLLPGSGGTFYCENCVRDHGLVRSLRERGHDVIVVPLYLPMMEEATDVANGNPVFFGAIRTYLGQYSRALAARPASLLSRWLDRPAMLNFAANRAGSTSAAGLEGLTLAMLHGEEGRQREELARLAEWLETQHPVDVVHISNALLLGLARSLKQRLGCAVVCSLQDENQWVEQMAPAAAERVWNAMAERAVDVDHFVVVSEAYGKAIAPKLRLSPDRWSVFPVGIDAASRPRSLLPDTPPVIGYLSRMSETLGLEQALDAVLHLRANGFPQLQLHAMGGATPADTRFLKRVQRKARPAGDAIRFDTAFDAASRAEMLSRCTLLTVPMPQGEALGLFQIEALAAGVPVVQPDSAGFREFIQQSGGGALYDPATPHALPVTLASLLQNRPRLEQLSQAGRNYVLSNHTYEAMAEKVLQVYAAATA